MEKQKRWQFYLILAVILLTIYNILPTVIYYAKPLHSPIDEKRAEVVAHDIINRVNSLEDDSKAWLYSFSNLLGVKPNDIHLKANDPRLFEVSFNTTEDAALFRRMLPRAGALIPFVPAQLDVYPGKSENPNTVLVSRQIGVHLNPEEANQLFLFSAVNDDKSQPSELYREVVYDRVGQLALAFAGPTRNAQILNALAAQNGNDSQYDDAVISLAKEIADFDRVLAKDSGLAKRYYAGFTQIDAADKDALVTKFQTRLEGLKTKIEGQRDNLVKEQKKAQDQGQQADSSKQQMISVLNNQVQALDNALAIVKKNSPYMKAGTKPLTLDNVRKLLAQSPIKDNIQLVSLEGKNPFVQALVIDWNNDKIVTQFFDDVQKIRLSEGASEAANIAKERMNQAVINDVARASRQADESILPDADTFAIDLNHLNDTRSFLTFNLGFLASKVSKQLTDQLLTSWVPKTADLVRENYPIRAYDGYKKEKAEDQKLGLVVYAPAMYREAPPAGFRPGSIYVIARGMNSIVEKNRQAGDSTESRALTEDFNKLNELMQANGFIGYAGSSYGMAPEFSKDFIFEMDDYYTNLVKATREDFSVKGSKRYAVLDFSDVEQRILTLNKIDDREQEDLLKWRDEYSTAQVDLNLTNKYQVPKPTKNVYWENLKLSMVKYFRGDDRKVLKWGLDLSGGKTVRIGLRDQNNKTVTNPDDLKQAVNELYTRVNKMGVAERTIHIEGNNIILDFPGSQNMSATDLVKASAMYFHIVNEKFGVNNAALRDSVNQFLQNVWNEAVVTNRKDIESINEIAWQQLGGESATGKETAPRSEHAKVLWDNGLRLANPRDKSVSGAFNDTLSAVGMMRGEDFSEWNNQTHPLMFVFHNFALEGSSLNNVQVGYDPTEGNILSFGVKRSYESADRPGSPRDDFYTWTSQFAEDKIAGTPKEMYSLGRGWRMAVILNGTIITQPTLRAALRDGATISGRFSQREINQLAADLKAGSLSFTPKILSEENVSPELGKEERMKGMLAAGVGLAAVVAAMVGYYHFAGVVASCAVLFNILIMWGVLQNIGWVLTLPGIAGIVLTIGMAVDANVLVFERIREEFSVSGRIASAIQAGYRKAFSAIIDSNITTIIAALILIQFDSGPIKGFAVTLIIGIISSMFTALFMTRYFFAGWVQNPKNKELRMSRFFGQTNFDFLAQAKKAIWISIAVMLVGGVLFFAQFKTMFGMDFTGGYSLNVELVEKAPDTNYRRLAEEALMTHGATSNDFSIRELSKPNNLRIQLSTTMEEPGHPFNKMPEHLDEGKFNYDYQQNPRITWLVNTLQDSGLEVQPSQLAGLDKHWTVISGQFSETMRNNAIIGLTIALISILVYITLRFEFKFAVGAVVGLAHDVVITLGILAFLHWIGLPVQIDLQVIGAIMTIIGYSLNDTIIVFDRIREDIRIHRKMPFRQLINHALNVTLSRTIMTSGTTILVLLALVLLGGRTIFAFSLVMMIGVIVGTLSSLFIASPVMLYVHEKEEKEHENGHGLSPKKA